MAAPPAPDPTSTLTAPTFTGSADVVVVEGTSTSSVSSESVPHLVNAAPHPVNSRANVIPDFQYDETEGSRSRHCLGSLEADRMAEAKDSNISLPTTTEQATLSVAPFLSEHVPQQYAPLGGGVGALVTQSAHEDGSNTKFCNRHRPDLKCRRQADEVTMEMLQNALAGLSESDQLAITHVWSLFAAAPGQQRNLMLHGIMAQCCFPQLSTIATTVRDLIKIDFLRALPAEISLRILCSLDTVSLCKAAQVSRKWRSLAEDDVVWHKMCEQHIDRVCNTCGLGLPLLDSKRARSAQMMRAAEVSRTWSNKISALSRLGDTTTTANKVAGSSDVAQSQERGIKRSISDSDEETPNGSVKRICAEPLHQPFPELPPSPPGRPWKEVYKARFMVGNNWKYGRCTTTILKGHSNGVMCLQFDEHVLATGSYDQTVKIWDIESGELLRTLVGHTGGIRCLQFDKNQLVSGGVDGKLMIWNWRTGQRLRELVGPTAAIVGLHSDANLLACGSMDNCIQVWNTSDKSTFRLTGHADWVNSVKVHAASRTIFSASDDCTIRLWDLDTRAAIREFRGHVGQVQQVVLLPEDFDLGADENANNGSNSGEEGTAIHANHNELDRRMHIHSPTAAQFPDDFASRFPTPDPVTPPNGSTNGNLFPDQPDRPAPPRYMLTAALDSTIRMWDVHTGRCMQTYFGHVQGIWGLAADTLRIVSGSEDRTLKIWDPRSGKCERTFTGHAGPVTCVGLSDSRIVTGSEDCEVRIHSFRGF